MNSEYKARRDEMAKKHNESLRYFENASFDSVYKNGCDAGFKDHAKLVAPLLEALEHFTKSVDHRGAIASYPIQYVTKAHQVLADYKKAIGKTK